MSDLTASQIVAINAKILCKAKGVGLREFEKNIGVSPCYLNQVTSGIIKSMSLAYAVKIADYFSMNLHEISDPKLGLRLRIKELETELDTLRKEMEDENGRSDENSNVGSHGKSSGWGRNSFRS